MKSAEVNASPLSPAVDAVGVNESIQVDEGLQADDGLQVERKLSATELLVRSSNDSELAVLLAAANDDPEELEDGADHLISPRSDALEDQDQQQNLANGRLENVSIKNR